MKDYTIKDNTFLLSKTMWYNIDKKGYIDLDCSLLLFRYKEFNIKLVSQYLPFHTSRYLTATLNRRLESLNSIGLANITKQELLSMNFVDLKGLVVNYPNKGYDLQKNIETYLFVLSLFLDTG